MITVYTREKNNNVNAYNSNEIIKFEVSTACVNKSLTVSGIGASVLLKACSPTSLIELYVQEFGKQGLTGPTGPQGLKGDKGDKGDTGLTGPQGEQGLQGPSGPQGIQGDASTVPGPQGPQGEIGPQGPQGIQGPQGEDGPQGPQGIQGVDGPQGVKGDDGASIVSGAFVSDDLVFTKDDATTVTIVDAKVDLKGDQGIQGIPGTAGANALIHVTFALAIGTDATTGTNKTNQIIIPRAGTISKCWINAKTAPVGADLICDINKGGTTIWSTQANRIKLTAGNTSGSQTSFDVTSVVEGDLITIDIDQIGSSTAGKDITVILQVT